MKLFLWTRSFTAIIGAACIITASFAVGACMPNMYLSVGEIPAKDPGAVIEPDMTTRQDVMDSFGQPDLEGVDDEGLPTWTYTRISMEVIKGKDAKLLALFNLKITFDGDLVKSYSYDKKAE